MRKVPRGRLVTVAKICKHLAKKHGIERCCSLTVAIFIMIAANASEEARREGADLGIPFWRTSKAGGNLNEKFPGGAETHKG